MIFADTFHQIGLIKFAERDSFLDHPPLLIKALLCKFVLPDVLQKIEQTNLKELPVHRAYLQMLLLVNEIRIFLFH